MIDKNTTKIEVGVISAIKSKETSKTFYHDKPHGVYK